MLSVISGLIVFGTLIVVHEWGHLLVAKALGARVPVFSIGLGPVLWKREWRGTEYRIAALPLGGYVLLDSVETGLTLSPLGRMAVFAAGPLANLVLAAAIFLAIGRPAMFGSSLVAMRDVLVGLFTGAIAVRQLAGPVGIMHMAGESAAQGWTALGAFAGFLSINLAVLNLLPLPILDGGQILIAAVEGMLGRPLNVKLRVGMALAGWAFMLGLFVFVTFGDLARWRVG